MHRRHLKNCSQKRLNSYIEKQHRHVAPIEIFLGYDENGRNETYQYVPVRESVKARCQHEDTMSQILTGHESSDGKIRDGKTFCDGSSYNQNQLFSGDLQTLQIQLYFDDFTTANPLGNKAKKFKISAFYFLLGNLKTQVQIQTTCNTTGNTVQIQDCQKVWTIILDRLISDIQALEKEGITVDFEGRRYKLYGTLSMVVADNLAAHSLGMFPENFSTSLRQ